MALHKSQRSYRFAEYMLDSRAFRLTRNGEWVKLEPKALDVLLCLLERPGELVSKQELNAAVWKGVCVTDNAATRVIASLRRVLDDQADHPRWIETVPTRGYRFIGEVATNEDAEIGDCVDERGSPVAGDGVPVAGRGSVGPKARPRSGRTWINVTMAGLGVGGAVALVLILALWVGKGFTEREERQADARSVRTLAVLPLRNLTGDPTQDFVADGMTQALSDRFSEFDVLSVVSTTSAARYRGTDEPATHISRELGADLLLEGAVARSGDRVRVSVGLVEAASGRRVWSRSFDQARTDILSLYDEIAVSAASESRLIVDALNATRRTRRPVDAQAYDEYLRAMAALGNRWMAGGCLAAEPSLLNVVERDPGFAPAHAALAWCYAYPDRLGRDVSVTAPRAKAEVAAALALDERSALAHAVNGSIKWRVDYDAAAGEAALRRARELDPSSGLVLIPSAELLLWRGQVERGLALLDRAIRLDPFSPDRNVQVGFDLLTVGRYGPALERFRRALALDPEPLTARYWIAQALAYQGQEDAAVEECLAWLERALRPERALAARRDLRRAFANGGWNAFWREELALAKEEEARPGEVFLPVHHNRYTGPWHMARRHARLGELAEAMEALETAYARRHHMMATLPVEPLFVALRPEARFQELLRKTGAVLPSASR